MSAYHLLMLFTDVREGEFLGILPIDTSDFVEKVLSRFLKLYRLSQMRYAPPLGVEIGERCSHNHIYYGDSIKMIILSYIFSPLQSFT